MEGDLLEVTLDETEQLWKLMCAARPPAEGLSFPDADVVKVGGRGGVVGWVDVLLSSSISGGCQR